MRNAIKVTATISADAKKVWDYYTNPAHIVKWNFADPSWHCPKASNDLKIGGSYFARMEAKDGGFGFDFEATYNEITMGQGFSYSFADRNVTVKLKDLVNQTEISVVFDPENEHPIEMQKGVGKQY